MSFLGIFLVIFIPLVIGIFLYVTCLKKMGNTKIILQARIAVETRLKYPSYIKFSPAGKTTVSADDNTYTVKGWVEFKNASGDMERNTYSVDVIVKKTRSGHLIYDTEFLRLERK